MKKTIFLTTLLLGVISPTCFADEQTPITDNKPTSGKITELISKDSSNNKTSDIKPKPKQSLEQSNDPNIKQNTAKNNKHTLIKSEKIADKENEQLKLTTAVAPITKSTIENVYSVEVPSLLTIQQAQFFLTKVSPKIAADQANIRSKEWQRDAVETINHPLVFAKAGASAYKVRKDIDLTETKTALANNINESQPETLAALAQLGFQVPPPNAVPPLGQSIAGKLPDIYNFSKSEQSFNGGVGVVVPLYTAGRVEALEGLLDARTLEAQAQAQNSEDKIYTLLVERYFNAQLAIIAAALRKDALQTIEQTDQMAARLYEEGFISLVQRMEAQTALADAQSEFIKSRNDSRLAMMSLQRLLRTTYRIKPTTPLFISTEPLEELSHYQDIALKNHPNLNVLSAKQQQAKKLHSFSDNQYKPRVSMFGYLDVDKKPSWMAGVSATWTLTGGLDKSALLASSQAQIRQADLSALDFKDNLLLLVEKNWHDVTNAQARYQALQANVALSNKVLELKRLGMQEGVHTALDVVQAQTQYLKASTEQAQAVNDYVQALAKLMQSCGTPLAFNDYVAKADILLPQLYQEVQKELNEDSKPNKSTN